MTPPFYQSTPAMQASLSIFPMTPHRIHKDVQAQSVSVIFYAGGHVSELGRSPTRMKEVLGCGLPVVVNAGVEDVARIIIDYPAGVLVTDAGETAMTAALAELNTLMQEPALARRCRQAAQEAFSLELGAAAYRALYDEIHFRTNA